MAEVCHGTLSGFLLFLVDELPEAGNASGEGEGHREATLDAVGVVRLVLDFGLDDVLEHVLEEARGVSGEREGERAWFYRDLDRDDAQDIAFVEVHLYRDGFSFRCFFGV